MCVQTLIHPSLSALPALTAPLNETHLTPAAVAVAAESCSAVAAAQRHLG